MKTELFTVAWIIHEVTPGRVQYAVYVGPDGTSQFETGTRETREEALKSIAACVSAFIRSDGRLDLAQ